ncbi:hypothetical protein RDABS01_034877 [Bienertia sinuspersici]
MEGLQRSGISFRRQGSSGLVWDDKLIQELNQAEKDGIIASEEDQKDHQKPDLRRTKSDGGGARRGTYRTVKVEEAEDPPSPRLSACGFCSVFGKPANKTAKNKNGKQKHK